MNDLCVIQPVCHPLGMTYDGMTHWSSATDDTRWDDT